MAGTTNVEHPALSISVLSQAAIATTDKPTLQQRRVYLSEQGKFASGVYLSNVTLSLPQGVGDMFAHRLGSRCGVRTASVSLTEDEPADFVNYYVRKVPGGWVQSRRVPNAMPLYYLKSYTADILSPVNQFELILNRNFRWALDKRCPVGRKAYADFPEPPSAEVLEAVRWNSRERLLGHAFRALLYCTYGHVSNCLVDSSARLWLIDHEKMVYRKDAGDIEILYAIASGSELVMGVCRQLCTLTGDDIKESLADIPDRFWPARRMTRTQCESESAAYFAGRLNAWKQHFAESKKKVMYASE